MSYVQVGSCPKCGAPIYSPMAWWGMGPPPVHYTCSCMFQIQGIVAGSTAPGWAIITTTGTATGTNCF